jgi:DNA helicase-2/ATP-dependent DNA helicase PcrA
MRRNIPYAKDLNPSQLEAVRYYGSPLLVLAGAGSGKTRVITYKIANLINEGGHDPGSILAVTFTNKASNEMRERVNELLGSEMDVWVKTFHSTAAKLLRIYGRFFGVDARFSIIDQQDQTALVKQILKKINVDSESHRPQKYVYLIESAKNNLLSVDDASADDFSTDPLFYDIYRNYEEILRRENLFDFGDLIYSLVRGLKKSKDTLSTLKQRFRYILVDEFQDTNNSQYELMKLLALPEGNICVVGDDDQSIYGFRGARVENVLNFREDYDGAKIIKLEENYRSYQTILTASSHVISNNPERLGKTLFTRKGSGEKLSFYRAYTDRGEALFIAREVQNLMLAQGYRYCDFAVFYRVNAQSRVLESTFTRARIPYKIVGGLRFYEREEIKDTLSYIRLLLNPMDEISLRRVIAKPPRGIGNRTIDWMVERTIARGLPFYRAAEEEEIPHSRARQVREFTVCMKELHDVVETSSPPELLSRIYREIGYTEWLRSGGKEEKLYNLDELYNAVEEFSRRNPASPISEFVEEVSLNQGAGEEEFADFRANERVFLITLHNAKGLEFPVVFMAGMEEGIFPHFLSGERREDLQEERRLCYVGMTRAMERLYFTAAKTRRLYGRSIERDVSNFIQEVPSELLVYREEKDLESQRFLYYDRGTDKRKAASSRTGARTSRTADEADRIEQNSRVVHEQYGKGKVMEVSGGIAVVEFDDGKIMKFMLKYTPIRKDDDYGH